MENSAHSPIIMEGSAANNIDKRKRTRRSRKTDKKSKSLVENQRQNNCAADRNTMPTHMISSNGHLGQMRNLPQCSVTPVVSLFHVPALPVQFCQSLPSTSRALMPSTPIMATNIVSQHIPNSILPSISKETITYYRKAQSPSTVKNSPVKEKSKNFVSPDFCNARAFDQKSYKSRNIWKPPVNNEIMETMVFVNDTETKLLTSIFRFDIKSIRNPSSGFFIRKRSTSCKYINLKSFSSNIPVIFRSKMKNFQNLNGIIEGVSALMASSSNKLRSPKRSNHKAKGVGDKIAAPVIHKKTPKDGSLLKANTLIDSEAQTKQKKPKKARLKAAKSPRKKIEYDDYPEYLDEDKVDQGLKDGTLIKGFIRINQRNNKDAYVTNIIKGDADYYIRSVLDQNRALDADEVILRVRPESEWDEGRKTAIVVYISKMVHSRTSVGQLLPLPKNENFAAFFPRDKRFPIVHIPTISWPQGFKSNPEKFSNNLFVAKITEWTNLECAKGLIIENVGLSGNLKVENMAILKTHGLDHAPFGNDVYKYLPKMEVLKDEWLEGREDLRKECIFTIDPLTARDLDDAVSCKMLSDGNLEIGVHIADVTQFLKEGTELDKQVEWKATTIYMVDQVYHMLPVELCMGCSLLPGKDKLSFSVVWKMTPEGKILSTRFAKTIMHSCVQLAYEHAQAIIDDPENFDASSFPKITNGYTIEDIKDVVLKLYHISKILRTRRFDNGALRIDQIKLSFELDPVTGVPKNYYAQETKEANRLIEEFMLLANISVAEKIIDAFPDIAFLRMHEPPKQNMLNDLKIGLESVGIHVDVSSAKSIHDCLVKYGTDDFSGRIRGAVLSHLFAKPMNRARYFCPAVEKAGVLYGHYALSIPLYTHFTSPIRRYADIMVHRLLAASLGLAEAPSWMPAFVSEVANRCNLMKYNAKKAQEESTKLYLNLFISKNGPFTRDAAVVDVREKTFEVLILDSGEIFRVYLNDISAKCALEEIPCIDLNSKNKDDYQKKHWRMKLTFPPTKIHPIAEIVIEIFTLVRVELRKDKKGGLQAKLVRPST